MQPPITYSAPVFQLSFLAILYSKVYHTPAKEFEVIVGRTKKKSILCQSRILPY